MLQNKYPFQTLSFKDFEFYSHGPRGSIKKIVKFSPGESSGVNYYNLGFGDWNEVDRKIDDFVTSGNEDAEKVLATVAATVIEFTNIYKGPVYARGSTQSRTRLYQIGINKHYNEISKLFDIFGMIEPGASVLFEEVGWHPFKCGVNYNAFLILRK